MQQDLRALQALQDQLVLIAQFLVLRALQGLQEPQEPQVLLVLTASFPDQQVLLDLLV